MSSLADRQAERIERLEAENAELRSQMAKNAIIVDRLTLKLENAEFNAWDSLARYKFFMFGYHAAQWVLLNWILGARRSNPWATLVAMARAKGFGPGASTQGPAVDARAA